MIGACYDVSPMAVVATKGVKSRGQTAPWLLTLEALSRDLVLSDPKNVGGKASRLALYDYLLDNPGYLPQEISITTGKNLLDEAMALPPELAERLQHILDTPDE